MGCLPPTLRRKEEQLSGLCPETCSALSSSPSSLPDTANARLLPEMSPVGTQKGCVHGDHPRVELPGGAKNHTYQASRSSSCGVLGGTGLAQPAGSQSLRSKHGVSTPSWPPPPGAPRQGRQQSAALWPRQRTGPAGSHCSALLLRRPGRQSESGGALGEPSSVRARARGPAEWQLSDSCPPRAAPTRVMTSVLEDFGWDDSAR